MISAIGFCNNAIKSIISKYGNEDNDWDAKLLAEVNSLFSNIYFITFNYDRLLEYKIWQLIFNNLRGDIKNDALFRSKISDQLSNVFKNKFYHPHGIIHPYAYLDINAKIQKNSSVMGTDRFGESRVESLKDSPGLMASCFDCNKDSGSFSDIAKKQIQPDTIYILGNSSFGLKNNLTNLPFKQWGNTVNTIICTSYDPDEQDKYKEIIWENLGKKIEIIFFKTCQEFIKNETD